VKSEAASSCANADEATSNCADAVLMIAARIPDRQMPASTGCRCVVAIWMNTFPASGPCSGGAIRPRPARTTTPPADTSKDDRIDKTEWVAYKLPADEFAKADKDKNGKIDGPEFVAWDTAYKAAHQGH